MIAIMYYIAIAAIAIYAFHKWCQRNFDYWEKRRIFYIEPTAFFGNYFNIAAMRTTIGEQLAEFYFQAKNQSYFGIWIFNTPYLVVKDPDILKAILVKDFDVFDDHIMVAPHWDPIIEHMLFVSKNPEWKVMRTKIRPFFSTGKLKQMCTYMNEISQKMCNYIETNALDVTVEVKEICARYSTDVLTKCAYSINAKSFEKKDAEFRNFGRMLFGFSYFLGFEQTSYFFAPFLTRLLRLHFFPPVVLKFIKNALWTAIKTREEHNEFDGNDIISTIIQLRQDKQFCKTMDFTGDKVLSQGFQMYAAGFETTSSILGFTLYELCIHPHIQVKLRSEIRKCVEKHGDYTYEAIADMKYLHMCLCEALRKYPTLPFLDRRCKTDYTIPGTDVVIKKDQGVLIPMFGLHYDPEYFHSPHKFIPERFDGNTNFNSSFSYIPFGQGPRNCIGERFGLLGAKIGLAHIVANFELEKVPETPIPIKFSTKSVVLQSTVGLPMKFRRIYNFNRKSI